MEDETREEKIVGRRMKLVTSVDQLSRAEFPPKFLFVCSCVSVCIGYQVLYAFASAYSSHNTGKIFLLQKLCTKDIGVVSSASSENQRISISQVMYVVKG
ncbi:hypothetical protein L1987_24272 [Smallanthus sonchifolius]|uniref:Uncharacterized protein n=1 Tax=Smallanthus sonchifolius TaxID=185202 RepID=A0ACB9ILB7_9ASTR|nr:hypothetical protein L1987_24272 [Smallanthus sonchifolius]